jgi:hypothetical protein
MLKRTRQVVGWTVVTGLAIWGAAALWFCAPGPVIVRGLLAALYVASFAASLVRCRTTSRRWLAVCGCCAVVWVWWLTIPLSNDRDWSPDMTVLPHADT